jgi:hypothetical protein
VPEPEKVRANIMVKKEKLKPCPFCGNSRWLIVWDDPAVLDDIQVHHWRVSCSMATGDHGCGASTGARTKREFAVKAWNRRVNDDDQGSDSAGD